MEPFKLLVVAIKKEWRHLINDALLNAGYVFEETSVNTKQEALNACNRSRFDLVISSCTLPDGEVADLMMVIGKLFPCMVISEQRSLISSERALLFHKSDVFVASSVQSSWISAVETALTQWKQTAQRNLLEQRLEDSSLHQKVLSRVKEELFFEIEDEEDLESETRISSVLNLLLEVLDISRIYICTKTPADGETRILEKSEATAPGVRRAIAKDQATTVPFFNRWNKIFSNKLPVTGTLGTLPPGEQQWLNFRDSQSVLAVPILSQDNWEGFIGLEDSFNPRQWSSEEINLIESVADLIKDQYIGKIKNTYSADPRMAIAPL